MLIILPIIVSHSLQGSLLQRSRHFKPAIGLRHSLRPFQDRFTINRQPYRNRFSEPIYSNLLHTAGSDKIKMTQQQQGRSEIPNTATILAIAGAALMMVSGILILAVSAFILPHLSQFMGQDVRIVVSGSTTTAIFNNSTTYTFTGPNNAHLGNGTFPGGPIPGFVAGITGFVGGIGLVSGIVVLVSAIMLRNNPGQRTLWGALIVVFSVLSFFGLGGFIIGAILGLIGGIMVLTWKPAVTTTTTATAAPA
jgi:Family of unknown function (DUF6114)